MDSRDNRLNRGRSSAALGALCAALAVLALVGCDSKDEGSVNHKSPAPPPSTAATPTTPSQSTIPAVSLLESLQECEIRHRGLLIDLGVPAAQARRTYAVGPFVDVSHRMINRSSLSEFHTRKVSYEFWVTETTEQLRVAMRGAKGYSTYTSVYLDDHRLGAVRLPEELGVVTLPAAKRPLEPGRHELTLRFSGRRSTEGEPYAQIDWLRLFIGDNLEETYFAPTFEDLEGDVVLSGSPKRSIVLRAPGSVRCGLRVVPGSRLRLDLGYWGAGDGVAQVRVLEDGQEPVTLTERAVKGGEKARWTRLDLPLDRFASHVVALELRAVRTRGGGRIAFGEPVLHPGDRRAPPTLANAKNVILIVASGLERATLPPWAAGRRMNALADLARHGTTFQGYRVPSSVIATTMASLLTGLSPQQHHLTDPNARLPDSVVSIAGLIKESGGRTAMFTGVPLTFEPFGFARGWDRFEQFSPVLDVPVAQPLRRATDWLKEQLEAGTGTRRFIVVHLRGGHPPWDVATERAAKLPPEDYTGVIEPRRGGVLLSKVQHRQRASRRRLRPADWVRLRAMQAETLADQDLELASLVRLLKEHDEWKQSMIVFAGDVAMGEAPQVPFGPTGLDEARLTPPLIVKWPGEERAEVRSNVSATSVDLAMTILDVLGVDPLASLQGVDLRHLQNGIQPLTGRALMASLGNNYSLRWGSLLLFGELNKTPVLCQLDVDPACANNLLATTPVTAPLAWRRAFFALSPSAAAARDQTRREEVELDEETQAALVVWGR